jgi:hypothetical protein
LRKQDTGKELASCSSEQEHMAAPFEHEDELSDSIKSGEILEQVRDY